MLNPFPILYLSMLAHFLLRVIVGGILLHLGFKHIEKRHDMRYAVQLRFFPYGRLAVWLLGTVEIVIGIMFILGFYTQIAALVSLILSIKLIVLNRVIASPHIPSRIFYLLLAGASLSLFITGAGAFAFDLPI